MTVKLKFNHSCFSFSQGLKLVGAKALDLTVGVLTLGRFQTNFEVRVLGQVTEAYFKMLDSEHFNTLARLERDARLGQDAR